MAFVYKLHVRQQMMKPGNGGYNVSGDCEKGLGRLLTAWAFVYPVAGIWARVREIWQIGRVVVRDFSCRSGKGPPVCSPGVGLFNGGAVATFRPVFVIHAASGAWLYSLWSFAMLCCLLHSNRLSPGCCLLRSV